MSVHVEHLVVFVGVILPLWTAGLVYALDRRYRRITPGDER